MYAVIQKCITLGGNPQNHRQTQGILISGTSRLILDNECDIRKIYKVPALNLFSFTLFIDPKQIMITINVLKILENIIFPNW